MNVKLKVAGELPPRVLVCQWGKLRLPQRCSKPQTAARFPSLEAGLLFGLGGGLGANIKLKLAPILECGRIRRLERVCSAWNRSDSVKCSAKKPGRLPRTTGLFRFLILGPLSKRGQRSGNASSATMQAVRKPVLFIASTLELLAGSGQIPCWREDKQGLAGFPSFSPLVVGRREGFA